MANIEYTSKSLAPFEEKMKKTISVLKSEFQTIRAGRANPRILDNISVSYYGVDTPLNQVANIQVPEARMLMITPWDKSSLKDVEKAILASDLGLTPSNDGTVIRLAIPTLTEERRKELVRVVRKDAEEHRVAVRNIRRDLNDAVKKLEKNGDISEDESHRVQDVIQEQTNEFVGQIDELLKAKEKEIMEV